MPGVSLHHGWVIEINLAPVPCQQPQRHARFQEALRGRQVKRHKIGRLNVFGEFKFQNRN